MQQACIVVFFFNDTATTEIYTLSLHDALPILAYNTEQIEGTPNNWVDLFDTRKFPGRRGLRKDPSETLEVALLGDGVPPENLYPLDVDRALNKLDTIKDRIVWWETGTQLQQQLADR